MIDTHHHFWEYNENEYSWISEEMSILRNDYFPEDIGKEIMKSNVDSVVSVQARTSLLETEQLLQYAKEYAFISGVVGWFPLCERNIRDIVFKYSTDTWRKGARHVLQAEPSGYMAQESFNDGIKVLTEMGLPYDLLVTQEQIVEVIALVDRHPNQKFIVDHIAKPQIKSSLFPEKWKSDLESLSKRDNVYCKVSGMVTEIQDEHWDSDLLNPYWEAVLDSFGSERIMIGSDWPVCKLQMEYFDWLNLCRNWLTCLSKSERENIENKNAKIVYNL
jgi:L-fuconolactonase